MKFEVRRARDATRPGSRSHRRDRYRQSRERPSGWNTWTSGSGVASSGLDRLSLADQGREAKAEPSPSAEREPPARSEGVGAAPVEIDSRPAVVSLSQPLPMQVDGGASGGTAAVRTRSDRNRWSRKLGILVLSYANGELGIYAEGAGQAPPGLQSASSRSVGDHQPVAGEPGGAEPESSGEAPWQAPSGGNPWIERRQSWKCPRGPVTRKLR